MPQAKTTGDALPAPTVLSSWTRVLVTALQQLGVDPDPLLREVEIDPASCGSAEMRFPLTATTRLWRRAVA